MSDQRCGRCGGVVGDFPPCGCATKEPVVVHPAPKAIRMVTLGVFAEEVAPVTASDGETVSRVCIAPTPSFFEVLHSKKLVLS
jgi:hypothetical protein